MCPINNQSVLVQVMAGHQIGAKSLPEPMLTQSTACMHHQTSVGYRDAWKETESYCLWQYLHICQDSFGLMSADINQICFVTMATDDPDLCVTNMHPTHAYLKYISW